MTSINRAASSLSQTPGTLPYLQPSASFTPKQPKSNLTLICLPAQHHRHNRLRAYDRGLSLPAMCCFRQPYLQVPWDRRAQVMGSQPSGITLLFSHLNFPSHSLSLTIQVPSASGQTSPLPWTNHFLTQSIGFSSAYCGRSGPRKMLRIPELPLFKILRMSPRNEALDFRDLLYHIDTSLSLLLLQSSSYFPPTFTAPH